jgi:hypothetical protein
MEFKNQKQLFEHIWETRPHVSEISGKPLLSGNHYQFMWQFAHILSKQAYPEYKLLEENIMLMLPDEHAKQESFEIFQDRKQELKEKYYSERQIKKL